MKKVITGFLIVIFAGLALISNGQSFTLSKSGTKVLIKGTSSLHDWEMTLNVINVDLQAKREGSVLKSIDNVSVSCKATDLKSESNLMDKKAYEALKSDAFPVIKFVSTSISGLVVEDKKFKGNVTGKLNVAGIEKVVTIPFNGTLTDAKTFNVTALTDISMANYKMVSPTAMMGALKTGDKITVSFELQFIQQ